MANGKHTIEIPQSSQEIWNFISDINKWAPLVPGYIDHEILNDRQSTWFIKGDLGFMKKKVNLKIDITEWIEPTKVTFDLTGLSDDLTGNGYFEAEVIDDNHTRITGYLDIEAKGAVGPMVTMTNTVLKKFVPQTAKDLTNAVANKIVNVAEQKDIIIGS